MKGRCAVSAASSVTRFAYKKVEYVLIFCSHCGRRPIITAKKHYDAMVDNHLEHSVLCPECSKAKSA